jgi:AcrR family transcriptional regulator
MEASIELVGEKGIQNFTTKKLASKIGFSEPAIYRHFGNKNEILKSILLRYKEQLTERLTNILNSEEDGFDKIISMLNFQFAHFSKFPAIIMVIFSETSFQYNNELSEVVLGIMERKKELVAKIIEHGQKQKAIRSDVGSSELATVIMGSMRFTVLKWRLNKYSYDIIKEGNVLKETFKTLLKG